MNNWEETATMLRHAAYAAFSLSLGGSDRQHDVFGRLNDVKLGDWVFEASTVHHAGSGHTGIGILRAWGRQPICTEEEWEEMGGPLDESVPTVKYWDIELMDGTVFRWTNASFVKVATLEDVAR